MLSLVILCWGSMGLKTYKCKDYRDQFKKNHLKRFKKTLKDDKT